jgi:two-component system, LuxR family, response regulator FixJ
MNTVARDPIFVIDDDPAARESVAALVRSHGLSAETYPSAEDFLEHFDRDSEGCVVVDLRMPGMSGTDLQRKLEQEGVDLPVIIITGYGDIPTAVEALRRGAVTYLEKPCSDHTLWESISQAIGRQTASRSIRIDRAEIRGRLASLTTDERRVMDLLLAGEGNKCIAQKLGLGLRTVELRRANMLQKMRAASLPQLIRAVMRIGYESLPEKATENSGS